MAENGSTVACDRQQHRVEAAFAKVPVIGEPFAGLGLVLRALRLSRLGVRCPLAKLHRDEHGLVGVVVAGEAIMRVCMLSRQLGRERRAGG